MQISEIQFLRIFESGEYIDLLELSDAKLRTDDGCNFDVHMVILAKSNDYFRRMFLGMGKRRRKFHIPGISGECLSDILSYIYTGELQITDKNIADLIIAADYLLLENLQTRIRDYIENNLTEVNCLRILLAAHETSKEYILRKCFRLIQTRFEEIMRYQKGELADFPLELLRRILSNRSLCVYDETTVWQAIVAWTQKDFGLRMNCVPRLLLTLATEDVSEELATEILQHEIVSQNSFVENLAEITSSDDFSTNADVLSTLSSRFSNCFAEPILRRRIPPQLFVVWTRKSEDEKSLYISYDENTDLWREIDDMESIERGALISMGRNIYTFDGDDGESWCFDLRTMNCREMERFYIDDAKKYCVVATDAYIYGISNTNKLGRYDVQVYDTVNNSWSDIAPLRSISQVQAVAIENKVYVVGKSEMSVGMTTRMFDPDTQRWSIMSPPTMRHNPFSVVAYHRKIYLIGGGSDAEVFDPATNLWKKLPGAFDKRSTPKARVINDQIVVRDADRCSYYGRWNNAAECWEQIDEDDTVRVLWSGDCLFCTVDDVDTIRMITKQNRDPQTQMESICFD